MGRASFHCDCALPAIADQDFFVRGPARRRPVESQAVKGGDGKRRIARSDSLARRRPVRKRPRRQDHRQPDTENEEFQEAISWSRAETVAERDAIDNVDDEPFQWE